MSKKEKTPVPDVILDEEEQMLLDLFEKGKLQPAKASRKKLAQAQQNASAYLKKDQRINIRISSTDLLLIKQRAAYEGLPYQTLIASILHKYAAGHA